MMVDMVCSWDVEQVRVVSDEVVELHDVERYLVDTWRGVEVDEYVMMSIMASVGLAMGCVDGGVSIDAGVRLVKELMWVLPDHKFGRGFYRCDEIVIRGMVMTFYMGMERLLEMGEIYEDGYEGVSGQLGVEEYVERAVHWLCVRYKYDLTVDGLLDIAKVQGMLVYVIGLLARHPEGQFYKSVLAGAIISGVIGRCKVDDGDMLVKFFDMWYLFFIGSHEE